MSENRLFDKRCAKHYISTGALNPATFQQHLDALPDLSEKASPIEARMEGEAPVEAMEAMEAMESPESPQMENENLQTLEHPTPMEELQTTEHPALMEELQTLEHSTPVEMGEPSENPETHPPETTPSEI